jgi:hypothetical protein
MPGGGPSWCGHLALGPRIGDPFLVRFQASRTWLAAVLATIAAGLLGGCAFVGPQSVETTCVTGEVLGSGEPGGPVANFFQFPGPDRAARTGPEDRAASAFEFTITNHTRSLIQVNGYHVITYSARGTAIGTWAPFMSSLTGRTMSPGKSYESDPVPDLPITEASGRFNESDTCKVFVDWFNPDANNF